MHFIVTEKGTKVGPEAVNRIIFSLKQVLAKYERCYEEQIHLVINKTKRMFTMSLQTHCEADSCFIRSRGRTLHAAAQSAIQKLDAFLLRKKDLLTHNIHGEVIAPTAVDTDLSEVSFTPISVQENVVHVDICSVEAAAQYLDAQQLPYMIFINADTKSICVLYKSSDIDSHLVLINTQEKVQRGSRILQ